MADVCLTIEELVAEGTRSRCTSRAPGEGGVWHLGHRQAWLVMGISIYRLAGGKIVEQWEQLDTMQQLRVLPARGAGRAV